MGRIEDLRAQEKAMDEQDSKSTATGTLEPAAIPPVVVAATDTATPPQPQADAPAAEPATTVVTVTKEEYDRIVDLLGKTSAETEKMRSAYLTIKGKYDIEVPRLQAEIKGLKENAATATPGSTVPASSATIDRIAEEYGDDIAETLRGQQAEIDRLKADKGAAPSAPPAEAAPEASAAATTEKPKPAGSFIHDLTVAFPEWQFINGDANYSIPAHPKWAEFLNSNNGEKQAILDFHVKNNNAAGAAMIFRQFRDAEKAGFKPVHTGDLSGLESAVEPATTFGGKPPDQGGKPILKLSDYKKFTDDVRLGRSGLTRPEIDAKLAEYDVADSEGRLR